MEVMGELFEIMEPEKLAQTAPLVMAYVGDCVYELFIRMGLCALGGTHGAMHKTAISYVNAESQCIAYHIIQERLTEAEANAYRRGRNANTGSRPRHASPSQYAMATGFEALFGWLWLGGQRQRAKELFDLIWQRRGELAPHESK